MTQALETLSRRMATLTSIRGLVRTMKTLSAVNAAPYESAAVAADRYLETVLDGMQIWFATGGQTAAPIAAPADGAGTVLAFGSDHGLCGDYNNRVADAVAKALSEAPWTAFAVGARMTAALTERGLTPAQGFMPPASVDGVGRLAAEILVAIDESRRVGGADRVTLIFMGAGADAGLKQVALLPLDPGLVAELRRRPWRSRASPMVAMDRESMFAGLIREYLFANVYRAAAQAIASENAIRLGLMQEAERNIDDRLAELLQAARSERQTAVTSELLDVVAGAEALRGAGLA